MYVCHTYSKSKDQPGEVANPAHGQLNRENEISLSPFAPRVWSSEMVSTVPSRASLLMSVLRLNMVLTYGIPLDLLMSPTNRTAFTLEHANPSLRK